MEECVYPDTRTLVNDQLEEQRGGDALRYVTPSLCAQPTPELHRNPSFVKSNFTNNDQWSMPRFQTVIDSQDDQKEREIDNAPAEMPSVPTDNAIEDMQLEGVNSQDSDETDSDFSGPDSQPSSLNYALFDSQSSEDDNQVVTPIDGEEREVNNQCSIEESYKGAENDVVVPTVAPVECEDTNTRSVVVLGNPKTVQDTVDSDQPEQKQQDVAKVLWRSNNWDREFPLDHELFVKLDEKKYLQTTIDSKGFLVTLVYKQVAPIMDAGVFNKLEKLDSILHCSSVVAYLENEHFGYIVKEQLENGMGAVVNRIINRQKTTAEDIARFHGSEHQSADTMSQWRSSIREEKRLKQLLRDLVTSFIRAGECLHLTGFVSLNICVSNLFVKFNCDCWDSPSCHHGSSGVTVVIGNCEKAYPIDSLVGSPNSKALQLLDPMHKYRRAEPIYDDLDIVMVVVKLLTKISGNRNCKRKLCEWMSDITNGIFNDPPVGDVQELFEWCGIAYNDTIKTTDYLKASAVHYARVYGEHEV